MSKTNLHLTDYHALAESRNLIWIGEDMPRLGTDTTKWKCRNCGSVLSKSFRATKNRKRGCRCSAPAAVKREHYMAIAKAYNLIWEPGEYTPPNTKVLTKWRLPNGKILEASYLELAYKMPNRVKEALGLPFNQRGGYHPQKVSV